MVDAGPLYALVDVSDDFHDRCRDLLEKHRGPLIVPMLVLTEVTYLLGSRLGPEAEIRFLGDIAGGTFTPEPVRAGDWLRIAELVGTYQDLPLGTVDASVVATAERLRIETLATLDRRRFSVVRPAHVSTFEIVP